MGVDLPVKFDTLHRMVPYVTGEKKHIVTMSPYNGIVLAMPGRHQKDTPILGADFVVMVSDETKDWNNHQFTHNDLFIDLEDKTKHNSIAANLLMKDYLKIIKGADPAKSNWDSNVVGDPFHNVGLHPQTFLYSVQALAVAEHRRYAKFEPQFGGRYLPFRFSAGIVEGLWDAAAAIGMQRRGRPGVEILEKVNGTPVLTKELMNV